VAYQEISFLEQIVRPIWVKLHQLSLNELQFVLDQIAGNLAKWQDSI
jgi:hypothetical protein